MDRLLGGVLVLFLMSILIIAIVVQCGPEIQEETTVEDTIEATVVEETVPERESREETTTVELPRTSGDTNLIH